MPGVPLDHWATQRGSIVREQSSSSPGSTSRSSADSHCQASGIVQSCMRLSPSAGRSTTSASLQPAWLNCSTSQADPWANEALV